MTDSPATTTRALFSPAFIFDLTALALAAVGNAMLAARLNLAPVALACIAVALVLRVVQQRERMLSIPFFLPWLLFLVSAWIGVSVSFEPVFSGLKFNLILGGIALYYVIAATETAVAKKMVAWGLVSLGAAVAIFFLTQTDFDAEPLKVELFNQIGLRLNRLAPQFGFYTPHANLMAGILLLSLPYALGLAYDALRHKRKLEMLLAALCALLLAFGLVMTTSRGALLALALLTALAAFSYAAAKLAKRVGYSSTLGVAAALNVLLLTGLLFAVIAGKNIGGLLNSALGSVNGIPRPLLFQQVFQLTQDYSFTGAGLDTFSPHFSTYELLINVPLIAHGHNLYLQVWYEQGILGFIAFIWLIAAYSLWTLRRRGRMNWLGLVSVAATTLMLMHGFVDVLFYFSRVISLMFIPLGLTVCALQPFEPTAEKISRRMALGGAAAAAMVLVVVGLLYLARRDAIHAQWTANLGALKQAQIELPKIAVPHPTPGQVRRELDTSDAEKLYQAALAQDATNRLAHARLGILALDRFDFPLAVQHLEAAYRADKNNRAVIKALGYAYVWTNKLDAAETLLQQIPEAEIELGYTVFEWQKRGRDDLAGNAQKMAHRLRQ